MNAIARKAHLFLAPLLLLGAAPAAATVKVGTPDPGGSGTCMPFSCFVVLGGQIYQQVYAASAFAGAGTISEVSFINQVAGDLDVLDLTIDFYLSPRTPGSLSSHAGDNRGALLGSFGDFKIDGPIATPLSFAGPAFSYDPAAGDLLMEITINHVGGLGASPAYFQSDSSGSTSASAMQFICVPLDPITVGGAATHVDPICTHPPQVSPTALVTEFEFVSSAMPDPAAVPEPRSWAMLLAGFGLIGWTLRRRRTCFPTIHAQTNSIFSTP